MRQKPRGIGSDQSHPGATRHHPHPRSWQAAQPSALGKKVVGEGYIGFAHAILQVGARSLLVSLWRVEDRSTAMQYRRIDNPYGSDQPSAPSVGAGNP